MLEQSLTAYELSEKIRKREISPVDVAQDALRRIEESDEHVRAFLSLEKEEVLKSAAELEKNQSLSGRLCGIPLANKDNILVRGRVSSCGSRILKNFRSIYSAHVIEKILSEKGIVAGNANMDEFAMGSSTETSPYRTTRNPFDLERVPGGSSGGPAAAVGAGQVLLALGSDTGGSIRQPAAFCGVVGLKPTYGRVSRYGLVAFASSLDQIGPLAGNVQDAALLLSVIAGHDERDSTSCRKEEEDYVLQLKPEVRGLKIGVPREYFAEGLQKDVENSVRRSLEAFQNMGAEILEISLPHTEYAVATYYILATAEASSNLARYDGVKYGYRASGKKDLMDMYMETRTQGFGDEVKRRILLGTFVLSSGYYDAYYRRAQKSRKLIMDDFRESFRKVDLIVTPTAPTTAFRIGEKTTNPLEMYLSDIYTISVNLAGLPAISVPCGLDSAGLPIGMQLIGPAFREQALLNAAFAFEQNVFRILPADRGVRGKK